MLEPQESHSGLHICTLCMGRYELEWTHLHYSIQYSHSVANAKAALLELLVCTFMQGAPDPQQRINHIAMNMS